MVHLKIDIFHDGTEFFPHTFKVRVPPTNILVISREWASGNGNELFPQDTQVTPQFGKIMKLDGKIVGFFVHLKI